MSYVEIDPSEIKKAAGTELGRILSEEIQTLAHGTSPYPEVHADKLVLLLAEKIKRSKGGGDG